MSDESSDNIDMLPSSCKRLVKGTSGEFLLTLASPGSDRTLVIVEEIAVKFMLTLASPGSDLSSHSSCKTEFLFDVLIGR